MASDIGELATRNVNYDNIDKYVGQQVAIHGKIESINNNTAYVIVQEDENKKIAVNNFSRDIQSGNYVKVIGTANEDKSINMIDVFNLENGFDLGLMNEVIKISESKELTDYFS